MQCNVHITSGRAGGERRGRKQPSETWSTSPGQMERVAVGGRMELVAAVPEPPQVPRCGRYFEPPQSRRGTTREIRGFRLCVMSGWWGPGSSNKALYLPCQYLMLLNSMLRRVVQFQETKIRLSLLVGWFVCAPSGHNSRPEGPTKRHRHRSMALPNLGASTRGGGKKQSARHGMMRQITRVFGTNKAMQGRYEMS